MVQVRVNGGRSCKVNPAPGHFQLDGNQLPWSVETLGEGRFSVITDSAKSRTVQVVFRDHENDSLDLVIRGKTYQVVLENPLDEIIRTMGLSRSAIAKPMEIRAPMPGLVLKVLVTPDQELNAGDPVLVLEAMKMENLFKSPGAGRVKQIRVQEGMPVEKGAVMIVLE
ncbi:MAG TPA: biotin/lipoyl-containing protein [Chitinophagaceae bacterium]|nr:biotin/lipoyl-containing protein [Chitinophagaceae bacterium]